jgi:hypothetical protein
MQPAICDGDTVTVAPSAAAHPVPGTVVVYRHADRLFVHRVVRVQAGEAGEVLTRGDALGGCDAPIAAAQIVGELITLQRDRQRRGNGGRMQGVMDRTTRILKSVGAWTAAVLLLCAVPTVAHAAVLQQTQSGTVTNTANGTQTVTISSVDITKSFLVFQTRSAGNRPVNTTVRGRLASSTTIEFERVTNEGAPLAINIQWYVATFGSGVKVQRGSATMASTTVNVGITAVASMNQAFVLWSMTPIATEVDHDGDDAIVGDLTSTTNLQFRTATATSHQVYWQVVEFTNAADINVQRGTTSLTGSALTTNVALGTAVGGGRTFVLAGFRTSGTGTDIGARLLRAQLINPTTLTFDRSIAGNADDMTEIAWQAVELKDGSRVQFGTASVASGAATTTAGLGVQVDLTRTIAFSGVQVGGQSMGRSAYAGDDVPGVASFTTSLSATQLTLNRTSTAAAADVGWFVVQFAGGTGFKVGSFIKPTGTAPVSQSIAHGLGEAPKALILWTEAQRDETFSTSTGIVFHGAATGSSPSGTTTLTLSVPAATVPNDVMIASVAFRPSTVVLTPPAGWTLVRRIDNATGSANSLAIYGRLASATEPSSYDWTFDTSTGSAGGIQSFAGVDTTNPVDVEAGAATANSTLHAAPTVTTTAANEVIVTTHAFGSGATWTPPAGMTEAFDVSSNVVPDALGISIEGSYVLQAAAGASGSKTATASNDTDTGNTHTLALRPAAASNVYFGFGMTDGTASRSVATANQIGGNKANTSTRIALKALTLVQWGEVTVAEADLSSWDDTTFTLNWTTNDAGPYVIHYIAIGGSNVSAKVVDWTMATAVGNKSVTGVGFQPDVVFHAHGGTGVTAALPVSVSEAAFGLGVMDFSGDQWALSNLSIDGSNSSDTQRGQQTNAALFAFSSNFTVQKKAAWVSMDTDGFTVNFSNTGSTAAARVFSLALKGVNAKPGAFNKATAAAPASQPITGVGFTPSLVFLASTQATTQANATAHTRLGLGASDGTSQGSSAFEDLDGAGTPTSAAIDKTSKVFVKVDNNTPAIDAEADLTARGTDGFTLNWTANDAVATEILYLSLAPLAVTEARLTSFTATRDSRGVHLAWRTGYEVNNLGFHLFREIDGTRTRMTRSLVAGSGLTVGSRTVKSEHSYSYWDLDRSAFAPGATYWLEDVDFNGRGTWHGPIAPAAVAADVVEQAAETPEENSRSLNGLGRGVGHSSERFLTPLAPDLAPVAGFAALRGRQSAVVADTATQPDPRLAQWAIAGQAGVKIGVRTAGWYRAGQPALVAAGLDPQVDPATLHLFAEGIEQPIVVTGAGDGHFDSGDAIEFYGTGTDTIATDTAVYFLTGGSGTGLRVQPAAPAAAGSPAPGRFWGTVERKDRRIYFAALRNGDAENWFGALIDPADPASVDVTVRHPDGAAPSDAVLEVTLQGVTATPDPVGHQVRVRVNGTVVGDVIFRDRERGEATLTVPHSALVDGANSVQFDALGGDADLTLFDTVRLSYWHTTDADGAQLTFTADGQQQVTIGGFSDPARVVDITDPQGILELPTSAGPAPSSIVVQTSGAGTRSLIAFTDAAILSPAFVSANAPSSLHDPANAYDYLIVTHADFAAQMAPLAALRASQGHQAAVVSIDDVYDEFSNGERSPAALKDFLTLARATWVVAPRYVVLAGDATFDPRDYAGFGFGDFVPTKLVDMTQIDLETASDDWFADANLDGLPDFAIGRLPVRTAAQAATVVGKIVAYDAGAGGAWTKQVALVTDHDDVATKFRASSAAVAARLPADFVTHALDTDALGAPAVRTELFDLIGQGQLIVNYLGHGSTDIWGSSGDLMQAGGVAASWVATGGKLPFVLAMNCLNGYFHGIYGEESLAEALLRADGGAVAVWASSSLTDAQPQGLLNDELYRLIFAQGKPTLGDAVIAAKRAVTDADVRRSWTFFGDPAMRLKDVPDAVVTPPALPTLTAGASTLNFGVIRSGATFASATSNQSVRLVQSGAGTVSWVATADQPWIQITNGSGTGSGHFSVGISPTGLPASGTAAGTVTVTATGAQASPSVTVNVSVIAPAAAAAPFGSLDSPQQGITGVSGAIAVTGWALDDVQVAKVQIFRDPFGNEPAGRVFIGEATLVTGARPDIEVSYPLLPFNGRAGWGYMLLTSFLPQQGNGIYTIHALATDAEGRQAWLGSRTFTCDNAHATRPFGSIDTPGPSAIASGTAYLNFGWALAPQGKSIPFDGSTIAVFIDSIMVGRPGPLAPRADIQALFPGYANTDHAVTAFVLDTTAYADGVHTIAWAVTDSDGVTDGIGSRFFTIDNAGGASVVVAPSRAEAPSLGDAGALVLARQGYEQTAPLEPVPVRGGRRQVQGYELERLELHLAAEPEPSEGWRYEGYAMIGGARHPLPVGSTLDAARGRFVWNPGAGFIGGYQLQFVRTSADGRSEQIPVEIVLRPRHRNGSKVEISIDRPLGGEAGASVVVAGTAVDRAAEGGSGVDAVNIWAFPSPGSGVAPMFLGTARPSVDGSFEWLVEGLAPGVYDLAAYPRSTVTGQFETPATVRVRVK